MNENQLHYQTCSWFGPFLLAYTFCRICSSFQNNFAFERQEKPSCRRVSGRESTLLQKWHAHSQEGQLEAKRGWDCSYKNKQKQEWQLYFTCKHVNKSILIWRKKSFFYFYENFLGEGRISDRIPKYLNELISYKKYQNSIRYYLSEMVTNKLQHPCFFF